ncbi:spermatogenesis-associated protein 20 isoform X2 [Rhodnius prolixus]
MATAQIPDKEKNRNRLSKEKSPYLLQHASNPVNWYPWGEEAFKKAREEDKLIFLSVGYSTCHWCHVMERESFENPAVAGIMNEYFVNIKVDREERPDIDRIYMHFVQATTKAGGWPMSVFLTPDLKPISGGTYFPPEDKYNLPGFVSVLLTMAQQWAEQRSKMSVSAKKISDLLEKSCAFDIEMAGRLINGKVPGSEVWNKCQNQIYDHYEPLFGGFSQPPKFPRPCMLKLLFHRHARVPEDLDGMRSKAMSLHTLDCMALGGIHDHIGQGFARYSVDTKWRVPHFEKMLYDQAQLAMVYTMAYRLTREQNYEYIARGILTYVSRDLSHPEGGFYSAEDADSQVSLSNPEKREGAFYTWEYDEVLQLLKKPLEGRPRYSQGELICFHYGIKPTGNVKPDSDPRGELLGKNVLFIKRKPYETCDKFGIKFDELRKVIGECKEILYRERLKRPRPQLDDKIITCWNGLMISGFAKAAFVFNDESYKKRAIAAVEFVKKYLYNPINKRLLRSCYTQGGTVSQLDHPIEAFQCDYACMIQALLDLYECTFDQKYLIWADELQTVQDQLFWDHGYAGYFSTSSSNEHNIFRFKDDQDGAEPSGNSVAAHNLLRLGMMLDSEEMKDKASQLLASFTSRLTELPIALPELVSALLLYHDSPVQVIITGNMQNSETSELVSVLRKGLVPGLIVMLTGDPDSFICHKNTAINKMKPLNGRQAAYVCRGHTCTLPITSPSDLAIQLNI